VIGLAFEKAKRLSILKHQYKSPLNSQNYHLAGNQECPAFGGGDSHSKSCGHSAPVDATYSPRVEMLMEWYIALFTCKTTANCVYFT